ncbi:MAG: lectin like domain-containing protein [Clostridiales Family XIII bacterium]|jgi:C1A family cysteine protease|nr:lectin like domain-containing protein [Clostridiales Family XIII bacterium]
MRPTGAKNITITAILTVALVCGLFAHGSVTGYSSAAEPADSSITPPDHVTFINVPDTAFEHKINNEDYYKKLFGDGATGLAAPAGDSQASAEAKGRKGGISTQAVTWSNLSDFDWRTDWNDSSKLDQKPKSSPVFPTRDQGEFGTCWAYSALASAESSLVTSGLATSSSSNFLSPYHLVFSAYNAYTFAADIESSNSGMNTFAKAALNGGGNADMAGSAMSKWFGPMPESQYKYPTGANPSAITSLAQLNQSRYHLQYALNFPSPNDEKVGVASGKGAASLVSSQLSAIKNAIYTYGPLATSYYADGTYKQTNTYYGGQSNGSTTYYQTAKNYADHGVTLVGWDDNVPAAAFDNGSGIRPKGNGAFLIQNSWGESWGDGGGFFWLSYYDPSIGTSTYFSLENTAGSDDIYYWDDVGYAGANYYNLSWYTGSQINYMSNVFTVGSQAAAHSIESAGVYASSPGTTFSVSIYKNPPADNPSGGTALAIGNSGSTAVNSTAKFAGYQTILFANPQHLDAGDTFAVVVKVLNNNTDGSALTCEGVLYDYGTDADHVTISSGQSYYSADGKKWTDLSSTYATAGSGLGNFNIRAYTSGIGVTSIGLSSDNPVQKTYKVGEAFNYKVGNIQISYADGTKSNIPLINNNVQLSGFDTTAPGTRTIKITFMGKTLTYQISVIEWTWVTGVVGIKGVPSIYKYSANAKAHSIDISSSVSPANASDKKINWSVTGPAIIKSTGTSTATLTFSGKDGEVIVTATPNDANKLVKTARILVVPKVTAIVSPVKTIYVKKNSSYTLPCIAYDGNTPVSTSLSFASDNTNALTVSEKGRVKTKNVKKKTKVIVTATSESGYKKKFTLYVVPKQMKLKSLKITGAPSKLKRGKYKQLSLKLNPSSVTNAVPKFTSSKPGVLSVDKTGKIYAKKKGEAKVTVRVAGKKAVTKYIKVT